MADVWQHSTEAPTAINHCQRVFAGRPHIANSGQQQPLSVPRFPSYSIEIDDTAEWFNDPGLTPSQRQTR
jgi:hypothetical protein